jgi:hypothetical protein
MRRAEVTVPRHCPASADQLLPVPIELLATPLDYIAAEHSRFRCMCAYLLRISAEGRVQGSEARTIVAHLTQDYGLYHEDENRDLFPMLRRRSLPEDDLAPILQALEADHATIDRAVVEIVAALRDHAGDEIIAIDAPSACAMATCAAVMRKHLSIEDSIVLVIARKRLSARDLATLSTAMAARRGVQP